jgi:DNA invertase Pin-like site-specific DNA recombinase
MLIGSLRVSKRDGSQTPDLQRDALLAAGVAPEHLPKDLTSRRTKARPARVSQALQPGTLLLVWQQDRSGHDLHPLVRVADALQPRQAGACRPYVGAVCRAYRR